MGAHQAAATPQAGAPGMNSYSQGETAPTAEVSALLEETVTRHIDPAARISGVRELSVSPGMSGATVRRYELQLAGVSAQHANIRLVTKEASLRERLTLAHLVTQRQPNVPFSHTLDLHSDAAALICMQDLGSTSRTTSLKPVSEATIRREAAALAAIHSANRGCTDLDWLPQANRAYYTDAIWNQFWRPHWKQAVSDPSFCAQFKSDLDRVESAAETTVDEMAALYDEEDALTLVHTDINPSNVLLLGGVPYIIDWQSAHYGPFYLDVPHHLFTPELAEHYRVALAEQGISVSRTEFAQRFRIAARYTALRYMWWTFEAWREDPSEEIWVRHYFSMI